MLWQAGAAMAGFDPVPASDREITQAILHDERSALLRSVQNGARRVDTAGGSVRHAYQDDHPQLGKIARTRTEALNARQEIWRNSGRPEDGMETGRAAWRGRVCPYVSISVAAVALKNKPRPYMNRKSKIEQK